MPPQAFTSIPDVLEAEVPGARDLADGEQDVAAHHLAAVLEPDDDLVAAALAADRPRVAQDGHAPPLEGGLDDLGGVRILGRQDQVP
jgi:hypothetical protein